MSHYLYTCSIFASSYWYLVSTDLEFDSNSFPGLRSLTLPVVTLLNAPDTCGFYCVSSFLGLIVSALHLRNRKHMCNVFLSSINLLAFYHKWLSLISSLRAGSHLGARARAGKSEFKSEAIQRGGVW